MTVLEKFSAFYTNLASMKIAELSDIYSKDVVFIDPIANHRGLPALEKYFSKLLKSAQYCQFDIHQTQTYQHNQCVVNWTMTFTTPRMNNKKAIEVDGISMLTLNEGKIIFHRDYYDMGQMVYENIPLLGRIIKKIKRSMA